jgi:hypothetical protein
MLEVFFTEDRKGNEAGALLFSSNDSPITRHGIPTFDPAWRDCCAADFRLRALAQKSALPPLVTCRFFQQNLSWCFGELGAESLI